MGKWGSVWLGLGATRQQYTPCPPPPAGSPVEALKLRQTFLPPKAGTRGEALCSSPRPLLRDALCGPRWCWHVCLPEQAEPKQAQAPKPAVVQEAAQPPSQETANSGHFAPDRPLKARG